jgi:L-alanine-DL-glutamate epimerase-like enolase superfamily enzyme
MHLLSRRTLLQSAMLGLTSSALLQRRAEAAIRKMKITRVRMYEAPEEINRPIINQSHHIVTIETDAGITGIGEGGSPDIMRQMAEQLAGQNPSRIDALWQEMYRGYFYPAGREKLHALGALDLALWDIKGKALGVPVWELLGGQARDHVECYATGYPDKGSTRESAAACMRDGFRAYRTHGADPDRDGSGRFQPFDPRRMVEKTFEHCREIRDGVGPKGDWAIDYHTRYDLPDAVRLSTMIEPLAPLFVEDLVRSENPGVYKQVRALVKVPLAVGEQFGDRWDANELIEGRLFDFSRVTIPNTGGLTEYWKHAALCETHYVGLTPHFTGPVSEAALIHCCAVFSGPCLMELGLSVAKQPPYLPKYYDFRNGKMWPNERPGLGVEFDASKLRMFFEVTRYAQKIQIYRRPDGSFTNW